MIFSFAQQTMIFVQQSTEIYICKAHIFIYRVYLKYKSWPLLSAIDIAFLIENQKDQRYVYYKFLKETCFYSKLVSW